MKKSTLFLSALIALTGTALQHANGGSAVAIEPHHCMMVNSYGHPEGIAVQRAMAGARHLYEPGVKLLASTDVPGCCVVGVAKKGERALVSVCLGDPSLSDARSIVFAELHKSGGINPRIVSTWRDSPVRIASN